MRKYSYVLCLLGSVVMVLTGDFLYQTYMKNAQVEAAITSSEEVLVEEAVNLNDDIPVEVAVISMEDVSLEATQEGARKELSVESVQKEHYQGTLYIGDSRTVGLYEYGNIENGEVFANSGMSVFNVLKVEETVGEREKQSLENLLTKVKYDSIHIMLGINELGYDFNKTISQYKTVLETLGTLQPDSTIIIGANLHVTGEKSGKDNIYNNANINKINSELKKIAEEKGLGYVDVNEIFDDVSGKLDLQYTSDGAHVLGKYYAEWVTWLKKSTASINLRGFFGYIIFR